MSIFIGHYNISFLDYWSIIHFASGLIVGIAFIYFKEKLKYLQKIKKFFLFGFSVLIFWELIEVTLRTLKYITDIGITKPFSSSESYLNIISDLIFGFLGFYIVFLIFRKNKNTIIKN